MLRHRGSCRAQATANGVGPCSEVGSEALAHRRVGLVQLEREAADRATVGASGRDDELRYFASSANTRSIGSGTFFQTGPSSISSMPLQYSVEHRNQHILLAREIVIETAAVRARPLEQVGNTRRLIALLPEELHCREDDALARRGAGGGLIDHSTDVTPI